MQNDALLEDFAGCSSAEALLAAILKHHPDLRAPVPVEEIARSAGITEFRDLEVDDATSGIVVDLDKATGIILCSAGLSARPRRYAIAHQLGHFLLKSQRGDRQCTNRTLKENRRDTPHHKEEAQANRFAAGLLMPKPLFTAFVDTLGKPTVTHLPAIAATFDVGLEFAASRYVDLTQSTCALLFIKKGVVRYARPSRSFPALSIQPGDPAPPVAEAGDPAARNVWISAKVRDWLVMSRDIRPPKLTIQVAGKEGGVLLVMLFIDAAAERRADEEAEKLATERPKFGR
jgi:Zn-dependent peptidase ImmA (M78 family)